MKQFREAPASLLGEWEAPGALLTRSVSQFIGAPLPGQSTAPSVGDSSQAHDSAPQQASRLLRASRARSAHSSGPG